MSLSLGLGLALTRNKGVGWSPTRLGASLLGWWDASRADKLTLSGSSVTTWTDIVGNYAATQAVGGSKPLYSVSSFNGGPGITFDGADDELTLGSVPWPATSFEVWALLKQDALLADHTTRVLFGWGNGTSATSVRLERVVSGTSQIQFRVGNGTTGQGAGETTTSMIGYHVARGVSSGTQIRAYVDGIVGADVACVPSITGTRTRIGGNNGSSAALFWQGQIAAVFVTAPLSAEQAAQFLTYLKARGGLT